MIIIRPITQKDQNLYTEFSFQSLLGMVNLPRDKAKFFEKISHSEACFSAKIQKPGNEEYYFVLEDLTTGRLGGICGIIAESTESFGYVYHIETLKSENLAVPGPKDLKIIKIVQNPPTSSEICALYLQHSFRHSGLGRLLSLSRLLFIAAFKERFRNKLVAELRGYIDERQVAPFWESLGRHFCDLSFVELMAQLNQSHEFIHDILPKYPIYVSLLPKEVQEMIGKTHESTKPAQQILTHENFTFHDEIDVFEGGPILRAKTDDVRTIKNSITTKIDLTTEELDDQPEFILANERLDFRACFGRIQFINKDLGIINEEVANALGVKQGDTIRYVTPH